MRTPPAVFVAGVAALLLAGGLVLFLVAQEDGTTPIQSSPAPATDSPASRELSVQELLADQNGTAPIRPKAFADLPELGEFDLVKPPEEVVVAGEVLDWDGTPATIVGVVALRLKDGAPGESCGRAETDGQGRFLLSIARPAPAECVLAAFKPARRPATLPLTISAADSRKDVRLALGMGSAIEGSITLDGKPVVARVSANLKSAPPNSSAFGWNGSAFETKRAAVYSDRDGRFVLTGLAPETYLLETDAWVSGTSVGLVGRAEVLAPASGVQFANASGRLKIRVLGRGEPLPQARVAVVDPLGARLFTSDSELRVAAGLPLKVEAAQRGFVAKQVAVPALAAGENRGLDLTLEPEESPDLHLRLRGASEMNLARVRVHLLPVFPEQEGMCVLKQVRGGLHAVRGHEDRFVLEAVPYPAGNYVVVLLPEPPASWFTPVQAQLSLPATGSVELALDVTLGGRLTVTMQDATSPDSALPGHYVLRDGRGAEVYSTATASSPAPGGHDARAEAASLQRSTRVIAAGTYEIEARSDGFRTLRQEITVRPGGDTMPVLQLEKEKQ
jgi:hypothetical protein